MHNSKHKLWCHTTIHHVRINLCTGILTFLYAIPMNIHIIISIRTHHFVKETKYMHYFVNSSSYSKAAITNRYILSSTATPNIWVTPKTLGVYGNMPFTLFNSCILCTYNMQRWCTSPEKMHANKTREEITQFR